MFYIYRWIRLDTNKPFYIGKGKGNRFKQTVNGRNKYFRSILKLTRCEVEIIINGLTEEQAFNKEIEFIKLYKDLGYCEANLTNGGEGSRGCAFPEEMKRKFSIERKGKHFSPATEFKKGQIVLKGNKHPYFGKPAHNRGIPQSEESKKKNANSNKGKQAGPKNAMYGKRGKAHPAFGRYVPETQKNYLPVVGRNLLTNEIIEFKSIKEATEFIKTSNGSISKVLSGEQNSTKNWVFNRLSNQENKEAA